MILYLIRHGESAFNAEGRIQGQMNPPLSELGRRQSLALVPAMLELGIEAVYASPLERAFDTARPSAAALGQEIRPLESLMELNAGIFQGKTWPRIRDEHPAESQRWLSGEADFRIPGGESRRDLMVRGRAVLSLIRQGNERAVAVFSHGGILSAALKSLLEIPAELNPFSFFNGSLSKLSWQSQIKLLTLNQIDHLRRPDGGYDTKSGDL
ncbi:MAG: histidine phosphatase family protein [Pirellulales bacterium]